MGNFMCIRKCYALVYWRCFHFMPELEGASHLKQHPTIANLPTVSTALFTVPRHLTESDSFPANLAWVFAVRQLIKTTSYILNFFSLQWVWRDRETEIDSRLSLFRYYYVLHWYIRHHASRRSPERFWLLESPRKTPLPKSWRKPLSDLLRYLCPYMLLRLAVFTWAGRRKEVELCVLSQPTHFGVYLHCAVAWFDLLELIFLSHKMRPDDPVFTIYSLEDSFCFYNSCLLSES